MDNVREVSELPAALLEELFVPDAVATVKQQDGSIRFLMYVGQAEGGYMVLKHAIIKPEDARIIFKESLPDSGEAHELPVPREPRRGRLVEFEDNVEAELGL